MNNYDIQKIQKLNKLIKDIYVDLENIKYKQDIYDDTNDKFNYTLFEKSTSNNGYGHKYKFPFNCDLIGLIYNKSEIEIEFDIFCYDIKICTQKIKPKEYLYPLHNLCIFPSFLFEEKDILSIRFDSNEYIKNITVIGINLKNKEKKLFDLTYFYCVLKRNNKCDLIYNNHYEFDREVLDDWIILSRFEPIVIKI